MQAYELPLTSTKSFVDGHTLAKMYGGEALRSPDSFDDRAVQDGMYLAGIPTFTILIPHEEVRNFDALVKALKKDTEIKKILDDEDAAA